jgi:hypothetical protein
MVTVGELALGALALALPLSVGGVELQLDAPKAASSASTVQVKARRTGVQNLSLF